MRATTPPSQATSRGAAHDARALKKILVCCGGRHAPTSILKAVKTASPIAYQLSPHQKGVVFVLSGFVDPKRGELRKKAIGGLWGMRARHR